MAAQTSAEIYPVLSGITIRRAFLPESGVAIRSTRLPAFSERKGEKLVKGWQQCPPFINQFFSTLETNSPSAKSVTMASPSLKVPSSI